MKRIIIIGEGQTEQAFCNDVLQPYFYQFGILLQNSTIKKSKGGIIPWPDLKKEINRYLQHDSKAYVTLLIDYYGLKKSFDFPGWDQAAAIMNKNDRMTSLETAMLNDIDERVRDRFIPYIQLHEFEGLLFCDQQIIEDSFDDDEFKDHKYLVETIQRHSNPEMINDGHATAPSKRWDRIIRGYEKTVLGPILAHDIGLTRIRAKCPRFNAWIERLSQI